MGKGEKIKTPTIPNNILALTVSERVSKLELESDDCIKISFKHLEKKQGLSHSQLKEKGWLLMAIEKLADYSCNTMLVSKSKKFKTYKGFPPKTKTKFTEPTYTPEEANWSCLHVNGKFCIIGHIVRSVFYVVFYDPEHEFWDAPKKHT